MSATRTRNMPHLSAAPATGELYGEKITQDSVDEAPSIPKWVLAIVPAVLALWGAFALVRALGF